ncbi:MAG: nucleotidyltransferase family protein, partial [Oscillospiraceae bacterium]|nr:nucleotidyltransferase family protein [Oscillospiraceae bacterium]
MGIIGIVSEYNPFHNGHEYHIKMSKQMLGNDSPVVCVMSGDFVQRGECAVYSKFARAEAACKSGADLVIELPLPWALSSAEGFARGAVGLLNSLGVSHLSFGSETGEIEPLDKIARCLLDPAVTYDTKLLMDREGSLSFPAARQRVIETRIGELSRQLEMPNNILAVEYLKALYELRSEMQAMTVLRFGNGHDQSGSSGP